MPLSLTADPEEVLAGLDPEQLEAARIVSYGAAILAVLGRSAEGVVSGD
ncbi:MAG TPA: hypothetical protein VFW86_03220 [Candidatus Limnocylindrales bacterium]|nr:hypothetical protein [Candidatus Limnocylindrales bacterium]